MNYTLMRSVLNSLCEVFDAEDHKSIIIDFSPFSDPTTQKQLIDKLSNRLISTEEQYYLENKAKLDDQSTFQQRMLELFFNNFTMKDYISGMICEPQQFLPICSVSTTKTQTNLQFLQYQQPQIKRGATIGNVKDIAQIVQTVQDAGVNNRKGLQMLKMTLHIDLNNIVTEQLREGAQLARQSQLQSIVPILDIQFRCDGKSLQEMLILAGNAFIQLNYQLVEQQVEPEYLLLFTNLADLYITLAGLRNQQYDQYTARRIGTEIAYRTVQVLFRSLPPAISGLFFTFGSGFLASKLILHFLNQLGTQSCFSCWSYGVVLGVEVFDQAIQNYGIVQRDQAATMTINQTLKVIQDALAGKYKDNQESDTLRPIQIGTIKA